MLRGAVLVCLVAGLAVAGAGAAVAVLFIDDPPALLRCDLGSAHARLLGRNTFLETSDGLRLGAVPSTWNREPVPLARMSPWLPSATVAIEDRRFWTRDSALDPEAIIRAAVANYHAGRPVQGGSTLVQQLVRDRYLRAPAPTFARKLKEACLAAQLEQRDSKRTILGAYLNEVYYGHHAYGAQAAAETYFSRPARRLTLTQAALLAGLPQAPSVYDPLDHPRTARRRRNEVLTALRTSAEISPSRYRAAVRSSLHLRPSRRYTALAAQPFFEYARRELVRRFGRWRARHGGLRIRTTLDSRLQRLATRAAHAWLGRPADPATAIVAIDPSTGAIRAMTVVAPGHGSLKFNLASQSRRQAGSTFKTFALTAAMEAGIPLGSVWNGPSSLTIPNRRCMNANGAWVVHNYADEAHGTMTLLQATAFSVNTIFAQVAMRVGPERVVDAAHRMGIESPLRPVCSITLGPEGVSPLEMADAFATLAARGIHHPPGALARVTASDGAVLTRLRHGGRRALSRTVADHVTYALAGVVRSGTGTAAGLDRPVAGKTGTAESFKDAWFCGFVPQLATCVWVGYPQAELPLLNLDGFGQVVGGSIPARIWHDFMAPALSRTPVRRLPTPSVTRLQAKSVYAPGGATAPPQTSR
ncbi:transglycosylase domain-containing protein [Candidatus Solirubrobacter pratensis]|uniref:transglycosylase domain-containing protein n=1 Tax=Candidatus Solirubrobacter pratensis TaxID=1298857 RepID=UPI0012DC903C|nr:transglycosylase domain-containing protein [Candidatus Solirubrobacter pratensis]